MNEKRCFYCQSLVVLNEDGNQRYFPYFCYNCDEELTEKEVENEG